MPILDLIEERFGENHLGMYPIPVVGAVAPDVEILRAYLGKDTGCPFFGEILAVIRCGERFFELYYHVWRAKQRPTDANHLLNILELRVEKLQNLGFLEKANTDFGRRAFWMYTPDSCLDADALALRAVGKVLKRYSVENKLCAQFRRKYTVSAAKKKI